MSRSSTGSLSNGRNTSDLRFVLLDLTRRFLPVPAYFLCD